MRVEVVVPQIGEAVSELILVLWHKHVGEHVDKGDLLFEIDSDKAIVEVEAFVDGTLIEVLSGDGSTVMPRDVVAMIETEAILSANTAYQLETDISPAASVENVNLPEVSPVARRMADDLGINLVHVSGTGPRGRILAGDVRQYAQSSVYNHDNGGNHIVRRVNASPKAKRIAQEKRIDLHDLQDTGVGGMIRADDVLKLVKSSPPNQADFQQAVASKLRETIAIRTVQSKREVPHFYLMAEINMTQAQALRSYCTSMAGWERPPTYTAILVRACALSLREFPWANQSYGMQARSSSNIGVAVDTPQGLMVPVMPDTATRSLKQTADHLREMVQRAQDGRLKPSDMGEKSMTISNLGMYSVDQFVAIIDQPDPMILAVGRVADRVIASNGQAVIQPMCTLTLSVDHRVLDGALGAQFLERLKSHLENPFGIMG